MFTKLSKDGKFVLTENTKLCVKLGRFGSVFHSAGVLTDSPIHGSAVDEGTLLAGPLYSDNETPSCQNTLISSYSH